ERRRGPASVGRRPFVLGVVVLGELELLLLGSRAHGRRGAPPAAGDGHRLPLLRARLLRVAVLLPPVRLRLLPLRQLLRELLLRVLALLLRWPLRLLAVLLRLSLRRLRVPHGIAPAARGAQGGPRLRGRLLRGDRGRLRRPLPAAEHRPRTPRHH